MIEISHQQARRLLREHSDRLLPEAQWMALQAHLESCPECRRYRDRLDTLESHLRRTLLARWRPIDGPSGRIGQSMMEARARRVESRRSVVYASLGLLAVLALVLFGPNYLHHASAPPPPPATPTVDRSTPTLSPERRFQGVVLFQTGSALNMLTAGPTGADVEPLTSDQRRDTDPAWSPDGEWVAFISDRALGGKPEIFLTNLVGGRLTQVTSDPGVDWQGPPVWSPDGRWLAVVGHRKVLNSEPWVYLVPVDGTGSRVLPGTRWVTGGLRFTQDDLSPNPNLLFVSSLFGSSIVRYDPETGSSGLLTAEDNQKRSLKTGLDGEYDYAVQANHYSLVYLASGSGAPAGWGFMQIRSMSFYINDIARQTSIEQLDAEPQGTLRSIHFMPGDSRIVYLQDSALNGCWKLQLRDTAAVSVSRPGPVRSLDGLCISGSLDDSSFSSNGRWLVVFAHTEDDPKTGLYAVELPSIKNPNAPISFQRLASVDNPVGAPYIRPSASSRVIQPKPVPQAPQASRLPSAPAKMEGMLLLSAWPESLAGDPQSPPFGQHRSAPRMASELVLPVANSQIEGLSPDGVIARTLVSDTTVNACPAFSPDRARIVYLSDLREGNRESWEIFVMDTDGGNARQLTSRPVYEDIGDPTTWYSCPVWSPDSKYIATIQHTAFSTHLQVLNADSGIVRSVIIDNPSQQSSLVWSPDGKTILFVEPNRGSGPLRVISFVWWLPTGANELLSIEGWEDAQAVSLSPDGKQLALMLVGAQGAQLRVYDLAKMRAVIRKDMRNADISAQVRPGRIFWLAGGQIAFAYQYRPYERYKSAIIRYDPSGDTISYLAYSEDRLYDWAINGGWLVYSTESGIWGIDINGQFDQPAAPIHLSGIIAYDLDWR